ncbi:protein CbbY [Jannaschia pagri]|uniref:Protein CbbY n=1 Tax=Jannaschia pagri TaxID=2829797 RepID=A0ABQ4NJJ6_9RHOB|nr:MULTISPECIES: HAD-IA family hydrolase [unclassified Jannaschia]GIT90763.1 protein CbbY [Jannaschia sp. AI_61]GIT94595.1 protein CbbY [Jannaschia sp. AI_62]
MTCKALLFGAIGTLAETSELQRRAFNLAFIAHDLDWVWEPQTYYRMLHTPGGAARIARYADDAGQTVDAAAVHQSKQANFEALVRRLGVEPRPGVEEVISHCRETGIALGLCTTTSRAQVELILENLSPKVSRQAFDWVGDRSMVARGKPSPDIYEAALLALSVEASDAIAIEDTPESAEAALAAGLQVIGVPGVAARDRAFPEGVRVVDRADAALDLPREAFAAE